MRVISEVNGIPIIMADGTIADLMNLSGAEIRFPEIAMSLSRIARWSGRHRHAAISVGQHSVMGADAIFRETGDAVPAGYFLLHDAHEYLIGDICRPVAACLDRMLSEDAGEGAVREAIGTMKMHIDNAIFEAAGLQPLRLFPIYRRIVEEMDERMCHAEARVLYGVASVPLVRCDLPAPRLVDSFDKPWGPMKAEEAFCDRLSRYLGIETRAAA